MKKIVLMAMVLFITIGALFAQDIKSGNSIAWMDVSAGKLIDTVGSGGDGYYSRIRINSAGSVAFYYTQMEGNKIVWAFTEIGNMSNLKDLGDNVYSYTVNGNKYTQGFTTLDNGVMLMWIVSASMGSGSGMSFVYSLE